MRNSELRRSVKIGDNAPIKISMPDTSPLKRAKKLKRSAIIKAAPATSASKIKEMDMALKPNGNNANDVSPSMPTQKVYPIAFEYDFFKSNLSTTAEVPMINCAASAISNQLIPLEAGRGHGKDRDVRRLFL